MHSRSGLWAVTRSSSHAASSSLGEVDARGRLDDPQAAVGTRRRPSQPGDVLEPAEVPAGLALGVLAVDEQDAPRVDRLAVNGWMPAAAQTASWRAITDLPRPSLAGPDQPVAALEDARDDPVVRRVYDGEELVQVRGEVRWRVVVLPGR